jgi:hypothetical protein
MARKTKHWTAYAWIACLAILFNAFVPVASHALGLSSSATTQVEVCTAMGIEMLPMPASDQVAKSASDKLLKSLTHCGYCAAHAGSFGLPPQPAIVFVASDGRDVFPPLYDFAPRPLFAWSLAQPRAPPVRA